MCNSGLNLLLDTIIPIDCQPVEVHREQLQEETVFDLKIVIPVVGGGNKNIKGRMRAMTFLAMFENCISQ